MKRHTHTIADESTRPAFAYCPTCKTDRSIYHDRSGAAFYARHLQAGRGNWCDMSSQKVKKA